MRVARICLSMLAAGIAPVGEQTFVLREWQIRPAMRMETGV